MNKVLTGALCCVILLVGLLAYLWQDEKTCRINTEIKLAQAEAIIEAKAKVEKKYVEELKDFERKFKDNEKVIEFDSVVVPDDIREWLCTDSSCL